MTKVVQAGLFANAAGSAGAEAELGTGSPESFAVHPTGRAVVRSILTRNGECKTSSLAFDQAPGEGAALAAEFDRVWLTAKSSPGTLAAASVRVADLFSGCGALSLGVAEACRALGFGFAPALAVDMDKSALSVYNENFAPAWLHHGPVEALLNAAIGKPISGIEREFRDRLGPIDLAVGGPPCQGHSNLNNHTRRSDPKNALYLRMARFAEVVQPTHLIIENVPGVIHDRGGVVQEVVSALTRLGYRVETVLLNADKLGVAQRRRRFFTVASRVAPLGLRAAMPRYYRPPRDIRWAIGDLENVARESTVDSSANHSAENAARIDFLFDYDLYDLPNSERPACHRLKSHTYNAVYGRLQWHEPAPTITTGFGSTGQGRFVHPSRRRTLTPHEAARLQFIPDFFRFGGRGRASLQQMIGNAVPPKLGYVLALELLR